MLMEFFIGTRIARAVSDPERLSLLRILAEGETRAEKLLAGYSGSRESLASQLTILEEAGLISSRVDGLSASYRIADESEGLLRNLTGAYAAGSYPALSL